MTADSAVAQGSSGPIITKLALFTPLSAEDRHLLERVSRVQRRRLGPHEDIIREGEAPDCVNLIVSGWACRYKQLEDGRRQILGFLLPGDFCDLRIFVLEHMDHSIGTITAVELAEVPRETILGLTDSSSRLARAFWWSALVAEAIEREWIVNLGQRTALERMGHLLCEIFVRLRAVGMTDGDSCELPLTQSELAETLGLSTVHINRTLQDLRGQGLVVLRGRTLTIPDLARLQKLSLFSENYLHLGKDEPESANAGARHDDGASAAKQELRDP